MDLDAVIIGSGAGGLAAALCLARAGKKVLVLEQHYVPGGWCHSFKLGGRYRFSPGVHYLGELQEGGGFREIYEGLGVADFLTFLELNPDGYDHVLVGKERFDIPKGRQAMAERLKQRFPSEAAGIERYMGIVCRIADELVALRSVTRLTDVVKLPWVAPTVLRWSASTLKDLFDHTVQDPFLRAILSTPCGDHGLPPSQASAVMHAAITGHYFGGGYYPKGGGIAIPQAFQRALRAQGGEVRLKTRVEKILIEKTWRGRRAVGVRLADGTEIRARQVISNADPDVTFKRLVGDEHLSYWLKRKLARTRYSLSLLSLFLATDRDLLAEGYDSGNYWWNATPDVEAVYAGRRGCLAARSLPGLFATITTLKDRSKFHGHHTLEAFAFVSYDDFSAWEKSEFGQRPEDYQRAKDALTKTLLGALANVIPGIEKNTVFAELATPLTNRHYVEATRGNSYGTEKTRGQIGPLGYGMTSEIESLFLCGASTLAHGVMGATLSGMAAAAAAVGCRDRDFLGKTGQVLKCYPADKPETWPPPPVRKKAAEAAAVLPIAPTTTPIGLG